MIGFMVVCRVRDIVYWIYKSQDGESRIETDGSAVDSKLSESAFTMNRADKAIVNHLVDDWLLNSGEGERRKEERNG